MKKKLGLGFIPKIIGFWVWVLGFHTQLFLGANLTLPISLDILAQKRGHVFNTILIIENESVHT